MKRRLQVPVRLDLQMDFSPLLSLHSSLLRPVLSLEVLMTKEFGNIVPTAQKGCRALVIVLPSPLRGKVPLNQSGRAIHIIGKQSSV